MLFTRIIDTKKLLPTANGWLQTRLAQQLAAAAATRIERGKDGMKESYEEIHWINLKREEKKPSTFRNILAESVISFRAIQLQFAEIVLYLRLSILFSLLLALNGLG